ncbi:MAG: hypothetical protein ACOC2N_06170, partial [Spirochaetota bacterium]
TFSFRASDDGDDRVYDVEDGEFAFDGEWYSDQFGRSLDPPPRLGAGLSFRCVTSMIVVGAYRRLTVSQGWIDATVDVVGEPRRGRGPLALVAYL